MGHSVFYLLNLAIYSKKSSWPTTPRSLQPLDLAWHRYSKDKQDFRLHSHPLATTVLPQSCEAQ
jgi:hypothetical protein